MNAKSPTTPTPATKPWERQPGESAKAYAAARIYFELGTVRSLGGVGEVLGKGTRHLKEWSSRWRWVARAAAYDDHLNHIQREAREAAIKAESEEETRVWLERRRQTRDAEWQAAQAMRDLFARLLEVPLAEVKWTARDLVALAEAAARLSRNALGPEPDPPPPSGADLLAELEQMVAKVYRPAEAELENWT